MVFVLNFAAQQAVVLAFSEDQGVFVAALFAFSCIIVGVTVQGSDFAHSLKVSEAICTFGACLTVFFQTAIEFLRNLCAFQGQCTFASIVGIVFVT